MMVAARTQRRALRMGMLFDFWTVTFCLHNMTDTETCDKNKTDIKFSLNTEVRLKIFTALSYF